MYLQLYDVYKYVKHDNEYNHQLMYINKNLMLIYMYPSVLYRQVMAAHNGYIHALFGIF